MNILKVIGKIIGALCVSFFLVILLSFFGVITATSNAIYSTLFLILTVMLIIYCIKRVNLVPTWEKKLFEIAKVVLVIAITFILINIAAMYLVITPIVF